MKTITSTALNRMNQEQIIKMLKTGQHGITVDGNVQGKICLRPRHGHDMASEMFLSVFKKENKKILEKPINVLAREGKKVIFYYVK